MIKENEPITPENEVLRERYLLELSDKIFNYFNDFCVSQNIQDMRKEPQNIFRAALKYIQFNVFHNTDALKRKIDSWDNFVEYKGRYNFRFLLDIYNIYENLCLVNNKEISMLDYCYLTGLKYAKIVDWNYKYNKGVLEELSPDCKELVQNIRTSKEATIEGNGKADLITMAKLNHYYDWNVQGIKSDNSEAKALTVSELRQKLGIDTKN